MTVVQWWVIELLLFSVWCRTLFFLNLHSPLLFTALCALQLLQLSPTPAGLFVFVVEQTQGLEGQLLKKGPQGRRSLLALHKHSSAFGGERIGAIFTTGEVFILLMVQQTKGFSGRKGRGHLFQNIQSKSTFSRVLCRQI